MSHTEPRTTTTARTSRTAMLYRVLWCVAAVLGAVDFFYPKHVAYKIEEFPAFYGIFGFVVAVGAIFIARELHKVLKRSETYYDR
jgi:hypothetical protein